MIKSRFFGFYGCFGKFREPPVEGVFGENESEGANGNLPFFVGYGNRIQKIKQKDKVDYGQFSAYFELLCSETEIDYENLGLEINISLKSFTKNGEQVFHSVQHAKGIPNERFF